MSKPCLLDIALPIPIHQTFHYKNLEEIAPAIGSRVLVNFRNRKLSGYVVGFPIKEQYKTKPVLEVSSGPPFFSDKMLRFFQWISTYYATPLGEVIKSAIPAISKTKKPAKSYEIPTLPVNRPSKLTLEQETAFQTLSNRLKKKEYAPYLLHGVTGSGKTEIYLRLIAKTLNQKRQSIVLVPEISLTPLLVSRFEDRFPGQIAVLHSRLTPKQRLAEWLKIKDGKATIAVGARSAIFAPFKDVGTIIVDEEHDASFKQEERFRYNGRDLALVRGQLENAIVVLGSATPALETYYNAQTKKIGYLELTKRVTPYPLPTIHLEDLSKSPLTFGKDYIFSDTLKQKLTETLSDGNQAILFLNRRGYSPLLLCQECGYVPKCPHCSVSFTVYLHSPYLKCHYCGHTVKIPKKCPDCDGLKIFPMGLGTEKVEQVLKSFFPEANIGRLDRSVTQKKHALERVLLDFSKRKLDILIGTQMIAKGHDFPDVTLVGVILADTALSIPDFRSPERTFQLMSQVSGRAGRGEKPGDVIIQTFRPEHYSLSFSKEHNAHGFYSEELSYRKEAFYPPYSRLIRLKLASTRKEEGEEKMKWLSELCHAMNSTYSQHSFEILGPSEAPIAKIKDKYRYHMLLKFKNHIDQKKFIGHLLKQERNLSKPPRIQIDVDPLNLL